ncbi:hypothetical protein [Pandoraea vervacti]|uniref:hypothetical protein n=1 Tax=Pandoraea vervacti TaxID=656178 RepID=UPI0012F51E8A|nr:hypothetical protein [Pandoraea vervacti]
MQRVSRWRGARPTSSSNALAVHYPLHQIWGRNAPNQAGKPVLPQIWDELPAAIKSDQRRIADVRHPTNHGAALGSGLARAAGSSGARRRQNPARYPHGDVTGTLLGKKLMGDFTAKASAKRVIHRNAHSTRIAGRPRRVNPSDVARCLRKWPAIATICREGVNIFTSSPFIHWQKVKAPPISAIIHSPEAYQWRIRDNGNTDRARVHLR